jgi:hypothetical protein
LWVVTSRVLALIVFQTRCFTGNSCFNNGAYIVSPSMSP